MSDRELLELAAKAAGIVVVRSRLHDPLQRDMLIENSARNPDQSTGPWNPLTDAGDALRLAVKLQLEVYIHEAATVTISANLIRAVENHEADPYAATRRAIVRAAAEIGRAMK